MVQQHSGVTEIPCYLPPLVAGPQSVVQLVQFYALVEINGENGMIVIGTW